MAAHILVVKRPSPVRVLAMPMAWNIHKLVEPEPKQM